MATTVKNTYPNMATAARAIAAEFQTRNVNERFRVIARIGSIIFCMERSVQGNLLHHSASGARRAETFKSKLIKSGVAVDEVLKDYSDIIDLTGLSRQRFVRTITQDPEAKRANERELRKILALQAEFNFKPDFSGERVEDV